MKESTKQNFLSWEELDNIKKTERYFNPIDKFLYDNEPVNFAMADLFRTQLLEALNYWDEESLTDHNANVVGAFMEHCKENGFDLPDSLFESYFGA